MNIDTLYSDTATITVLEITAISLDLWLAASATMNQALFWNSLLLSLTVGLIAAYPVYGELLITSRSAAWITCE